MASRPPPAASDRSSWGSTAEMGTGQRMMSSINDRQARQEKEGER